MSEAVWRTATESAPAPERVRHALRQLESAGAAKLLESADAEQARILAALWSGSEWAAEWLSKHPEWMEKLEAQEIIHPRRVQGLQREIETWLAPLLDAGEYGEAVAKLRQLKQREMIRIAARDLARLATTAEIIAEISHVADVCLGVVLRLTWQQL